MARIMMTSIIYGAIALLCVILQQEHPSAAYTCYSCSTTTEGCSCCNPDSITSTCQGGGCSTVYYPDGNVTRMCDNNVKHGCNDEGENRVCGCHAEYCNTNSCPAESPCSNSSGASSTEGLAIAYSSIIIIARTLMIRY